MVEVVNVKVAHIRPEYSNLKEWCSDPNHLYIGRKGIVFVDGARYPPTDSSFANPYRIGVDGITRETCLIKYEKYIRDKIGKGHVDIDILRGRVLGCWCKPDRCHGDILLKILREMDSKVLAIVGDRRYTNYLTFTNSVDSHLETYTKVDTIVTGDCRGTDEMASRYAMSKEFTLIECTAYWDEYGKRAGPIRNTLIVDNADALLAFVTDRSLGSWDTISKAKKKGIPVKIIKVDNRS
jgi:hypothetical protein